MSSALLLALLGITLPLPGVRALNCHWGIAQTVRNVSEQPFQWKTSQQNCGEGLGCQETVIITQNEPLLYLLLIKGCTQAANQEARVTEHRAGPGLSITSYTRVCRENLCNDLSTSLPLWTPLPPTVPGSVQCPVCLSTEGCLSVPEMTCPAESSHCYNGVLHLTAGERPGEGGSTRLKVQGCISQAGCNLLNGTQEIGPISLRETCSPEGVLTCYRGIILQMSPNLSRDPVKWSASREQQCNPGEVCQETLLLIDVGPRSILLGSKGCSQVRTQATSIHSRPPGVLVASYTRVCSSNYCNSAASSSVLINVLPRPAAPAPGHLQCPICLALGSCSQSSNVVTCPKGTSHCYKGEIFLQGGGLVSPVGIQGCVAHPSSTLLSRMKSIGVFDVTETLAQKLFCQKGTFTGIQENPANTFNWTSEKVEACDNGALCQETILLVKTAGTKTAILATKSCSLDGTPAITYIRHAADPGLVAISYSNYCEDPFCNNREGLYDIWNIQETKEETKGTTGLRCPTCLAVGSCLNAPSLACPNDTDRCYQGKLQISEGNVNSLLEVKGCTSIIGCRLMSGVFKHEWNCWHGDEAEGEEDEVSRPEGAAKILPESNGRRELQVVSVAVGAVETHSPEDEPPPYVYNLPETPTTTSSYTIPGFQVEKPHEDDSPPCAFPFTYRRKIYYKCTSVNSEREWCSLDEDYVGRWKICSDGDRPKCHFPFIYRDKRYFRCTTEGSAYGLAWCSLTEYFEREYAWQYCDRY
ncbi:hypothetical protein AB1E19_013470 [Capra hircus]